MKAPGARPGNVCNIAGAYTTVDLEANRQSGFVNKRSRRSALIQRRGNKRLSAKPRVDRHQQYQVDFIHHVLQWLKPCRRIKYQTGLATCIANHLQ